MGDQSEGEHAFITEQKVQTGRGASELSSDSLPDDTIKTRDDSGISTKSDSKPHCPVRSLSQLKAIGGGHGKHMQVVRQAISSEKPFFSESKQENNRQDCNTDMVDGLEQGAACLINESAKGGKNSDTSERVIAMDASSKEVNRPGKPVVKYVSWDSVDIEWDAVTSFCNGDVYQVRCENIGSRKWNCQNFEINSAKITRLQSDTSYIFNVRLVKSNGEICKYGETCKEVRTQLEVNRPGKPVVKCVSWDSVDIEWDAVASFCNGDVYQVRCENIGSKKWNCQHFEINSGKITRLQPGTSYIFSVCLVKRNGEESNYGETSKEVRTQLEVNIPGKPVVKCISWDSVDIEWDAVASFCNGDVYQVRCENSNSRKGNCQKFEMNSGKITCLQPGTSYIFSVRLIKKDGEECKYGEISEEVTTKKKDSYVSMLLLESKLVETKHNGLRIYQLPMKELLGARNGSARTKKMYLGPRNGNDLKEKTIMLVGATGTGKSTFVDGLANYILGVRLEDPFRFTVIPNEDKVRQHNQAESQTDWISCYSFKPQPGTRITYILNIIDTPGFGDVRGLERDHETVDQIRQLFEETGEKGIENLDAVCFLLKAPDSRLTVVQRYIFHAIMALFGHNIKGNICTVITFADGSEPPVLSAMEASHLPFGQHKFTFNNSALKSDPNISLTSMFWEMNLQNYEEMFKHFETLETKSAHLTKEVLQERRRLDITCQNLQIKINDGLSTIDSLNKEIKIFHDNEEKIRNNENFTYTVTERKEEKKYLPDGYSDTYCLTCNETCHTNCWITYETRTGWCWAMNWLTGKCGQCRGKCHWRQHTNRTYRIETSEMQVTKTFEERKKNFQDAKGHRLTLADVLKKMDKKLEQLADSIEKMLNIMLECKTRLMKTALQPSPLEMTDLIDLLIATENFERRQGYSNRVQVLHKIRDRTTIHTTVEEFNTKRFCQKETLAATCKDL